MFFNFWTLSRKIYLSEIATFLVTLYFSSQVNFVNSSLNVKDLYFYLFANVAMITELASFFPILIAIIVKETNFFNTPIPQCLWLPNLTGW